MVGEAHVNANASALFGCFTLVGMINATGGVGMFRCNDHGGGIGHCRGGMVLCLHTWVSVGVVLWSA